MEHVLQEKASEQEVDWDSRMGGEEMADSGFLMEEDVELDSGFCVEVDSELSLAGQVSVGSGDHAEELDWSMMTEDGDCLFKSPEQREGSPGGDGWSQTQEECEMGADSGSVETGETEAETGDEVDDQTEEEQKEGALDVCVWPVEESGGHVRISLEEVERYYRFSRRCHWLCGRYHMFYQVLTSFSCTYHKMIIPFPQSFFHHYRIYCFFLESYPRIIITMVWFRYLTAVLFCLSSPAPLPLLSQCQDWENTVFLSSLPVQFHLIVCLFSLKNLLRAEEENINSCSVSCCVHVCGIRYT